MKQDLLNTLNTMRDKNNSCLLSSLADTIYDDITLDDLQFEGLHCYAIIVNAMQHAKTFVRDIAYDNELLFTLISLYIKAHKFTEVELAYVKSLYESLQDRIN